VNRSSHGSVQFLSNCTQDSTLTKRLQYLIVSKGEREKYVEM
jgi:hypothetical protein